MYVREYVREIRGERKGKGEEVGERERRCYWRGEKEK